MSQILKIQDCLFKFISIQAKLELITEQNYMLTYSFLKYSKITRRKKKYPFKIYANNLDKIIFIHGFTKIIIFTTKGLLISSINYKIII